MFELNDRVKIYSGHRDPNTTDFIQGTCIGAGQVIEMRTAASRRPVLVVRSTSGMLLFEQSGKGITQPKLQLFPLESL